MLFGTRPRRFVAFLVGAFAATLACVSEFDRDALGGRPCPCLPGWVCDESLGSAGICVEETLGSGGSSGSDTGSGGTYVTHDGPDSGGAAGSDAPNFDAGLVPNEAGTNPGTGGSSSTGGAGTGECLPAALPTTTDCPAVCDDCSAGTCHIRCDGARDCSALSIDCPPGLHCEVACSAQDNCNATEVRCTGAQACDVLCTGKRACIGLTLGCAEGPCTLQCGGEAQVCRDSTLSCGSGACEASCQGNESPAVIGCGTSCSPACGC